MKHDTFLALAIVLCLMTAAFAPAARAGTPADWWNARSLPTKILLVTGAVSLAVPLAGLAVAGTSFIPVLIDVVTGLAIAYVGASIAAAEGEAESDDAHRPAPAAPPSDPAAICLLGTTSQH